MYILDSYNLAILFCFVTMLGWGSWANTLKMSSKEWVFPLYYWDYSLGLVVTSLMLGLTMGSIGDEGRGFISDLNQAELSNIGLAFIGGVVFNLSNLLIVAATAIAGMSVAFPLAVGLALVIGVVVNYMAVPIGDPMLLFGGVLLVVLAIVLDALAYKQIPQQGNNNMKKGIVLSILSGVLMGFFYRFVASSMTTDFASPESGFLTSYSAMFVFTVGIFISNFAINTWFMYKPVIGKPVTYSDYFKLGTPKLHGIGLLGGVIWCVAMEFNLIASEQAGFAISYGLGQGATMIAAIWGVFVWKEFSSAPKSVNKYLIAMFISFVVGLTLIVVARII